jgi:beta-glucosidase
MTGAATHDDAHRDLRQAHFGDGFTWGVASASYQVEGAWNDDGKGPSIWDTFTHRRWTVKDRTDGDVACDFYHRYRDDIALVDEMHFGAKRFSISWPRILPEGTGRVEKRGLDFYQRVVDACLERGIEPWITLYHWDLPQALQDRGGWTNRAVLDWFGEYVGVVADALGDRVRHWMVFNEPLSFVLVGHLAGVNAPGFRNPFKFLAAAHHVNLCQGVGARVLRERCADPVVGTTQWLTSVRPTGTTARHRRAARAGDALLNRMYLEPNLGLGYPVEDLPLLRLMERYLKGDDERALAVDFDFLGVQYYTRLRVPPVPIPGMRTIPLFGHDHREYEVTAMGWEVQPNGLYDVLNRVHGYGRFNRLVITENGAAFPDRVEGDRVHDPRRVRFCIDHLTQVRRAVREGVPVDGYFYWSLTDNFEWAEGYRPRFGLVYVDYATQRRIIKDSGRWFQQFLAS